MGWGKHLVKILSQPNRYHCLLPTGTELGNCFAILAANIEVRSNNKQCLCLPTQCVSVCVLTTLSCKTRQSGWSPGGSGWSGVASPATHSSIGTSVDAKVGHPSDVDKKQRYFTTNFTFLFSYSFFGTSSVVVLGRCSGIDWKWRKWTTIFTTIFSLFFYLLCRSFFSQKPLSNLKTYFEKILHCTQTSFQTPSVTLKPPGSHFGSVN